MKGHIVQRYRCADGHLIDMKRAVKKCKYKDRATRAECGAATKPSDPSLWYIRVELSRGTDGKRRQRRETLRGTKADADRRLRDLLRTIENGGYAEGDRITIAQLAKRWLDSTEHRVGVKCFHTYSSFVRFYIEPELGAHRAASLRPAHIEAALAAWRKSKRQRIKGQLSSRTVAHIFNALRAMCRWGVKMGFLVRNPVEAVEAPRADRKEMRALDAGGVSDLLAAARGTELETLIVVAVGTGLRRGELLGLRWSDVDLDAGRLSVRRSVMAFRGKISTKAPKTAKSARTIALPAFVVDALHRRRTEQLESRLQLGLGRSGDCSVFAAADESAIHPNHITAAFATLVRRAKLPHVRFHDLRHSFGTLALASGVDLKTVSTALGHSTIAMTANTYVHAIEGLQRDAAARIDTMLGKAVGDALFSDAVPQRCHTIAPFTKKARGYGLSLVRETGLEPARPCGR